MLKKDLRLNMPSSLLMPVARTDLLDLLMIQDKIANSAKDAKEIKIESQSFALGFREEFRRVLCVLAVRL